MTDQPYRQSFEDFYHSTYPATLRLAFALMRSTTAAEDLVQDAYAKMFRNFERIKNPDAYLRRTVVNLSSSLFRRRAVSSAKAPLIQASAQTDHLEHDLLLGVLDAIPARQRAAIVLRYYEQCTESEIASILRCRPGTVKSLLSRGIAALREVVPND